MGSFTFAFLLGELVHEFGHYLCHMAYGNVGIQVHMDPFGGSHISGTGDLPDRVLGVTSAAGPLLNLALALVTFFFLWRLRRPILLPLLLWGPVAMIQEGVTFSLGLLTPGGDAAWISTLGVPQPIILLSGIIFLTAGIGGVAFLLPLAGINLNDPPRTRLFIVLAGMCSLMLIRAAHSVLAAPESTMENLAPLVLSLLLAAIVVMVNPPITRIAGKVTSPEIMPVGWSASILALTLAASMYAFQIFAFN
jgi:hypothetical protein